MKAKLIYAIAILLTLTSCKKGMGDMMMGQCQKDQAMCRSMCAKMLDSPDALEFAKNKGVFIKNPETGVMDKEATLNKMMEMCTQNKSFCREVCGKMMNNGGMVGMMR